MLQNGQKWRFFVSLKFLIQFRSKKGNEIYSSTDEKLTNIYWGIWMKYLRNRFVFHLLIRKHCCSKYGCRKHIFVNRFVQALLAEIWSSKNKVHRFLCYYHFFENAENKIFDVFAEFCPILWYSQMICNDTITLYY